MCLCPRATSRGTDNDETIDNSDQAIIVNPYQSPSELRRAPFLQRFRNAMSLATKEFRRGLRRDNISVWHVFQALICVAALFCIALVVILLVGFNLFALVFGS